MRNLEEMTIAELNKEYESIVEKGGKASNEDIRRLIDIRAEISFRTVFSF